MSASLYLLPRVVLMKSAPARGEKATNQFSVVFFLFFGKLLKTLFALLQSELLAYEVGWNVEPQSTPHASGQPPLAEPSRAPFLERVSGSFVIPCR